MAEIALRVANPHEDWFDRLPQSPGDDTLNGLHPILGRLNIPLGQKAAIEDYSETIQTTQMEQEIASQDSTNRGPAIPFLLARTVEVRMNTRLHRTWCLNNINLLAPISISVWKIWANLSNSMVKACEDKTLNAKTQTVESQIIANAFPLTLYEHYKCTTSAISVHTKQDVLTCPLRQPQHTSKLWNCCRPYLQCQCSQNAKSGCRGNMIWFDHSI